MQSFQAWVKRSTGGATIREISDRIRHAPNSMAKWLKESSMPADAIVELAHAYDTDPIAGLRAAGILTDHDITRHFPVCVTHIPTPMLTEELHRRAQQGAVGPKD